MLIPKLDRNKYPYSLLHATIDEWYNNKVFDPDVKVLDCISIHAEYNLWGFPNVYIGYTIGNKDGTIALTATTPIPEPDRNLFEDEKFVVIAKTIESTYLNNPIPSNKVFHHQLGILVHNAINNKLTWERGRVKQVKYFKEFFKECFSEIF